MANMVARFFEKNGEWGRFGWDGRAGSGYEVGFY